jgi:hypothetical protein
MPQASWEQAQAVSNYSSYRLPANATLRKIKARMKPGGRSSPRQRRPTSRAASDERDKLLNTQIKSICRGC